MVGLSVQDFVGVYWTRPVPWARFYGVDTDITQAARQSRTIAYQLELVSRYAKEVGGEIIEHIVLNDLHSDRASLETVEALEKRLPKIAEDVTFLWVDFSQVNGWRKHPYLAQALEGRRTQPLYPQELMMAGQIFDPISHFQTWQRKAEQHGLEKTGHAESVMAFLAMHTTKSWPRRAKALNDAGILTHGGKIWSADNLRKFTGSLKDR